MTERVCSCLLPSPHLATAHVRMRLGKHIRRVYMRLKGVFQLATCAQDITFKRVFLEQMFLQFSFPIFVSRYLLMLGWGESTRWKGNFMLFDEGCKTQNLFFRQSRNFS